MNWQISGVYKKLSILVLMPFFSFAHIAHVNIAAENVLPLSENNKTPLFLSHTELPSLDVMQHALQGYQKLLDNKELNVADVITIIDFTKPSDEKRLWVVDMVTGEVLFHTLVAHGRNTGALTAEYFSNKEGSYASSPGFYTTGAMYVGKNGWSMYLDGKEQGINDNARARAVVMHGAAYANEAFVTKYGRLGRSQGCPAIPEAQALALMQAIAEGSCLYIHTNKGNYLSQSSYLRN
jgi:hypothetical protein